MWVQSDWLNICNSCSAETPLSQSSVTKYKLEFFLYHDLMLSIINTAFENCLASVPVLNSCNAVNDCVCPLSFVEIWVTTIFHQSATSGCMAWSLYLSCKLAIVCQGLKGRGNKTCQITCWHFFDFLQIPTLVCSNCV